MASNAASIEPGVEGLKSNFFLYQYEPSVAAAALFIGLFAITTALHLYQMIRTRTWFFIPFVCGGICKLSNRPFVTSGLTFYNTCRRNRRICRTNIFGPSEPIFHTWPICRSGCPLARGAGFVRCISHTWSLASCLI